MAPIHYAIDSDDYECLSILLKYGARVNIKSKVSGSTYTTELAALVAFPKNRLNQN